MKDLECTAWCLWTYLKNTLLLLLQIQAVQSILDSWYLVSRLLRNSCVHWLFFEKKKKKTVGGLEVKWVKRKDQSIKSGKLSQVISWNSRHVHTWTLFCMKSRNPKYSSTNIFNRNKINSFLLSDVVFTFIHQHHFHDYFGLTKEFSHKVNSSAYTNAA